MCCLLMQARPHVCSLLVQTELLICCLLVQAEPLLVGSHGLAEPLLVGSHGLQNLDLVKVNPVCLLQRWLPLLVGLRGEDGRPQVV